MARSKRRRMGWSWARTMRFVRKEQRAQAGRHDWAMNEAREQRLLAAVNAGAPPPW